MLSSLNSENPIEHVEKYFGDTERIYQIIEM